MYKKLIFPVLLLCLALAPGLASHAESGIKLQYGSKTYTAKQAAMPKSGFPFIVKEEDDVIILNDKSTGIAAEIDMAVMSNDSVKALRSYYNDQTADKNKLFGNLTALIESCIDAEAENYRINYLYGNGGDPGKESNIKLFSKAVNRLYGQDSDVYVYNTIGPIKNGLEEITHIDIFVPIRSAYTILNVSLTMKASSLNTKSIGVINRMLGCIRISGFPAKAGTLQILKNNPLIAAVNSGIYPKTSSTKAPADILLEEHEAGFRLKYPASLIQYMQHSLIDGYYYNSFKLSPNEFISIAVEPEPLTGAAISTNEYHDCTIVENGTKAYVRDYLLINNNRLYRLQLKSTGKKPTAYASSTFSAITSSLQFYREKPAETSAAASVTATYLDEATGLCFRYPSGWILANATSSSGLKLNIPDISDSVDIYVSEGDTANSLYKKLQSKLLFTSSRQEGECSYVYRLVNYISQEGCGKLCSSITISKGSKIFTMYIDVNSNWVKSGRISDARVAAMVNNIVNSFCLCPVGEKNKGRDESTTPLVNPQKPGFIFSCS